MPASKHFELMNANETEQATLTKILDWDLSREKEYLVNKKGYRGDLDEMEQEYKKYMFLRCVVPHGVCIPTSEMVDDLWHAHVLDTRRYQEFCQEVKGEMIHHKPTAADEENFALMPQYQSNTLSMYRKYFGEPNAKFWVDITPKGSCCTH